MYNNRILHIGNIHKLVEGLLPEVTNTKKGVVSSRYYELNYYSNDKDAYKKILQLNNNNCVLLEVATSDVANYYSHSILQVHTHNSVNYEITVKANTYDSYGTSVRFYINKTDKSFYVFTPKYRYLSVRILAGMAITLDTTTVQFDESGLTLVE